MKTYRELIVWQKSMSLVNDIYKVSKLFPNDENFNSVYENTKEIERMMSS
jgi:hypothetical protein